MAISKKSIEKIPFSYPLGIDEHYDSLVKIAEDPDVCWYCGKKASGTIRCTYTVYRSYNQLLRQKDVKRTFPFRIHICKDCLDKHKKVDSAETLGCELSIIPGLAFTILYCIFIKFPERIFGRIIVGLMYGIAVSGIIGVLIVSPLAKKIARRRTIKSELRTLGEHPFIRAMEIYESGVQSKDEYKVMLASWSFDNVDEFPDSFKEYKEQDQLSRL